MHNQSHSESQIQSSNAFNGLFDFELMSIESRTRIGHSYVISEIRVDVRLVFLRPFVLSACRHVSFLLLYSFVHTLLIIRRYSDCNRIAE